MDLKNIKNTLSKYFKAFIDYVILLPIRCMIITLFITVILSFEAIITFFQTIVDNPIEFLFFSIFALLYLI